MRTEAHRLLAASPFARSARCRSILLLLIAAGGCQRPADPPAVGADVYVAFRDPREVIHEGRFVVDVMEPAVSARLAELTVRFQEAFNQVPEESLRLVANAKPGEPLPYDPVFGLTPAEHEEFLVLVKQLTLRRARGAPLKVETLSGGAFALDGGDRLPDLTDVIIDLEADVVLTPFGVLREKSIIDADAESLLGAWEGVQWQLEELEADLARVTFAKFAVGRLKDSGRAVMYYDVNAFRGERKTRFTLILLYPVTGR